MTGLDFIKQAMQELGVLDLNRDPTGAESNYGQKKLNQLVGLWNTQKRLLWADVINEQAFPSSKQSYTIGPSAGADFNFPRPVEIKNGAAHIGITTSTPEVYIPVTMVSTLEYLGIPVPGIGTNVPVRCYYDQGFQSTPGAAPASATPGLGTLYFNPYPTAPLPNFRWATRVQIAKFTDLTTDYLFPDGVEGAIVFSLAETMTALEPPDDNMTRCVERAAYFRSQMSGVNIAPPRITTDLGLGGRQAPADYFNWETGNIE